MKILVDGDGCPVRSYIEKVAKKFYLPVQIYIDTSHLLESSYSEIITVSKGLDSVDFALIQAASKGDIVVTGDYGVATMALVRGCYCCNFSGGMYTDDNIDQLLLTKYLSKKEREAGLRGRNMKKRTIADNQLFEVNFIKLIEGLLNNKL